MNAIAATFSCLACLLIGIGGLALLNGISAAFLVVLIGMGCAVVWWFAAIGRRFTAD